MNFKHKMIKIRVKCPYKFKVRVKHFIFRHFSIFFIDFDQFQVVKKIYIEVDVPG